MIQKLFNKNDFRWLLFIYIRFHLDLPCVEMKNPLLQLFVCCSAEPRNHVVELNAIEMLLQILQDYDTLSKKY